MTPHHEFIWISPSAILHRIRRTSSTSTACRRSTSNPIDHRRTPEMPKVIGDYGMIGAGLLMYIALDPSPLSLPSPSPIVISITNTHRIDPHTVLIITHACACFPISSIAHELSSRGFLDLLTRGLSRSHPSARIKTRSLYHRLQQCFEEINDHDQIRLVIFTDCAGASDIAENHMINDHTDHIEGVGSTHPRYHRALRVDDIFALHIAGIQWIPTPSTDYLNRIAQRNQRGRSIDQRHISRHLT